jgi:ankyrin repeat protein
MKRLLLPGVVLLLVFLASAPRCIANINDDLFQAIKNKDVQKVRTLLAQGADANTKGESIINAAIKITPLDYAMSHGGVTEIVGLLIEKGANIHNKNVMGDTPLITAALFGYTETVRLLLAKGADMTVKNAIGYTALMNATMSCRADTVKLLLEKGANINDKDTDGSTLLHMASCCSEVITLLLAKGLDVNAKNQSGNTPFISAMRCSVDSAKLLISKGADINAKNNQGNTALYIAEVNNYEPMIAFLRQSGAQGGKLAQQVPTALSESDVTFLAEQCHLEKSDIDSIPKLDANTQKKLFARISLKDCKLLAGFKTTKEYYRSLKPNSRIPMPPAGNDLHYLTEEEFKNYQKILDEAPW